MMSIQEIGQEQGTLVDRADVGHVEDHFGDPSASYTEFEKRETRVWNEISPLTSRPEGQGNVLSERDDLEIGMPVHEIPSERPGNEQRQRKLTEKGKAYRLTELKRRRQKSKREIEMQINNIEALMSLDDNLKLVNKEVINLNGLFKKFGDIHEEILDILEDDEAALDSEIYKALCDQLLSIQTSAKNWALEVNRRMRDNNSEKSSARSRAKSKYSKCSKASSASSRAKLLEAKAKQAELQTKLAVFDKVKAANDAARNASREAEKLELIAECKVAAAVSKVYEDADKEDKEQDLGSDDPDTAQGYAKLPPPRNSFPIKPHENETVVVAPISKQQGRGEGKVEESNLNPDADEFKFARSAPLQSTPYQDNEKLEQGFATTRFSSGTNLRNDHTRTQDLGGQTCLTKLSVNEPPSTLWEKMELRMSQPPPKPTPFDGDPARYLRFRSNFRDQVESKSTLSNSEKMNYLLAYTTGRAREAIETYEGLPNGYQLALNVLQQRFGQNAMIIQSLKSSVVTGPKIRASDSASLLAFSDKIENCYWSMLELNSSELDCTTNLKLIYDRLPDPLQRKWRKEASLYRQRSGGREPTLKELCAFITAESQIENDPVYGSHEGTTISRERLPHVRNPKVLVNKAEMYQKARIPTFTTQVETQNKEDHPRTNKTSDACKVCKKGKHDLTDCAVFATKNVKWRRRFARYGKLCYRCLAGLHKQSECPSKDGCNVKNCNSPLSHHSLLHVDRPTDDSSNEKGKEGASDVSQNATSSATERNLVMLKVVPMRVVAETGKEVTTYGLLDTAAVSSMITSQLAEELQLQGTPEKVKINTVLQSNHECVLPNASFAVTPANQESPSFHVRRALVVDDLNVPERYCPSQIDLSTWPHLQGLKLSNEGVGLKKVTVLLGQDVPQAHVVYEYSWGDDPPNQPYGTKTPFAWCVAGPISSKGEDKRPIALSILNPCDLNGKDTDMTLHKQVEKFWTIDNQGLSRNDDANSIEDARALDILERTTKQTEDGGYEVGLLWKRENVSLPNNRRQAEQRLEQLKKRFKRDQNFAERYKIVMNDYIKKGYARKLSSNESNEKSDITWYLPHHGVVNPNKSKVRVVYDAAVEYKGACLNKELLQGPQLNNSLVGVLLRFRKERVAVASDIEGMFHQVKCLEKDTDALRFLWWSEDIEDPPSDHKMTVHLFGKADSPCVAAWALKKTATDHGHEFGKEVSEAVKRNFYVDDCLVSAPTPEQAIEIVQDLTKLLKKGNFRLTKFTSNSKDVLSAIPAEERTTKDLDLDSLPIERALGVQWDTETDTFGVKAMSSPGNRNSLTRRDCLSVLSSTFDPFGMVGPVLLQAKKLVQRTWQLKLKWDDELPEELRSGWNNWKKDLALLNQVNVPRCYFTNGSRGLQSLQLHHFSDASEVGYGTVSYLRKESIDGNIECAFLMAKSRTAPVHYVSMPRLELQAATVAVRAHRLIKKEIDMKISESYFWTDSKITLQYIHNESRRFKTFVANRVAEIREVTQPIQWRHCPGDLNPADDASRGLSAKELLANERWLRGPEFLSKPKGHWPTNEIGEMPDEEAEIKTERPIFVVTAPSKLHELLTRYSSWSTLLKRVAWLLKFKEYMRQRCSKCDSRSDIKKHLTPDDLERSSKAIVKLVQHQVYAEEIRELTKNKAVKLSSSIVKLHPVMVDDVIRVGGRITEAPVSFDSKFPMIIPPSHHVTRLLIEHFHQGLAHAGQDHILAQMRERYWIPKGRSAVRKVVRSCFSCRKYQAAAMEQMMAALPAFRTTAYEPCFTHSGVDYFGPLNVKRGRAVVKRWGAIFTCLNSRAVHLELASSLETDCFINLLRRFINRRGTPRFIYSDNGTNFVGAEREIREAIEHWNQEQISTELLQKGVQWVFQPPKASHASGVWERLIRSSRKALKAILGESLVDEEVASTVLTEVESVLNSRPLCAASDDPSDFETLTPSHLLLQRPAQALPPGVFVNEDIYCRKKWKQAQLLTNHFWKRWLKEYVAGLQERQKWNRVRRNAEVGDIVLLVDNSLPRGKWPLGRVLKTIRGRDGLVRTVEVKTKGSTLVRPIQKLCLLEEAANTG